jgi:thymidylate synthase
VWDKDANENVQWVNNPHREGTDDLGRIYGVQWRQWSDEGFIPQGDNVFEFDDTSIDQLKNVIDDLKAGIDNRREIITAWNPVELHMMALPPCHYMMIFSLTKNNTTLDLSFFMRSNDVALGLPYNIAQYAFLLHLIARITNKKVGNLHYHGTNVHIYEPHIEGLKKQISRLPKFEKPKLTLAPECDTLEFLETTEKPISEWVDVKNYDPHDPIKFEMFTETK